MPLEGLAVNLSLSKESKMSLWRYLRTCVWKRGNEGEILSEALSALESLSYFKIRFNFSSWVKTFLKDKLKHQLSRPMVKG